LDHEDGGSLGNEETKEIGESSFKVKNNFLSLQVPVKLKMENNVF
jgi:hypothetical protein